MHHTGFSPVPATLNGRWQSLGMSGGGGMFTPAISPHDPNLMLINCDMSGSFRSVDGGQTWQLLHWRQLTGGTFCTPVFHPTDPNVVFAAYCHEVSSLRISRDRGVTWQPFGSGLPGGLRLLAIDSGCPRRMLAGTTDSVYVSRDGGETWKPASGISGQSLGFHFDQTSPPDRRLTVTATAQGIFRSQDGGLSWVYQGQGWPDFPVVAFAGASNARSRERRLYVWLDAPGESNGQSSRGMIYRSDDGAETWQKIADMPVRAGFEHIYHFLLTTDVAPGIVYAVKPCYSNDDTVWRSDDAGIHWRSLAFTQKNDPRYNLQDNYVTLTMECSMEGWATLMAAIDPVNPDHLMFDNYISLFISANGGRTWKAGDMIPAPDNPGREAPALQHRWINNGLVVTNAWNFYIDPFDRRRQYIAYTDIGMARSSDEGATWVWERRLGANTYEMVFDPEVPGRLWAAFAKVHDTPNNNTVLCEQPLQGPGCIGYSEDGGLNWKGQNRGLPGPQPYDSGYMDGLAACVYSIVLDPRSPQESRTLYASIWEYGVYRSEDSGQSWHSRSAGLGVPGVNQRVCRVRLHPDGTLFVVITGKMRGGTLMAEGVGLYRSRDAGAHWEKITPGLDVRWLTSFELDPRDSRVVYLAACDDPGRKLQEGGLYKTTDGGLTWNRLTRKSAYHFGAGVNPRNPDWVYMTMAYNNASTAPLWLSRDAGKTWVPFEDYPFCSAQYVTFDPADTKSIYVTTYGASVWKGPAEP
jgi:photosystem II stability/assembly factor-like uncharacterized protein